MHILLKWGYPTKLSAILISLLLRKFNCIMLVIPSEEGIHYEFDWMPDHLRHDFFDIYFPV